MKGCIENLKNINRKLNHYIVVSLHHIIKSLKLDMFFYRCTNEGGYVTEVPFLRIIPYLR